jgi:hypothetical protein
MTAARQLAKQGWTAREVVRVFPDDAATRQFLTSTAKMNQAVKTPGSRTN